VSESPSPTAPATSGDPVTDRAVESNDFPDPGESEKTEESNVVLAVLTIVFLTVIVLLVALFARQLRRRRRWRDPGGDEHLLARPGFF
jgi:heme/copper-type cytochrome/quinol oxidase subunit 2